MQKRFWQQPKKSSIGLIGECKMAKILHGKSDAILKEILDVLRRYEKEHPEAKADVYRRNSVSVRIRVIDPSFFGLSKTERSRRLWQYLHQLPERAQSDITVLLLLAPDETKSSLGNLDFEKPLPSTLQ